MDDALTEVLCARVEEVRARRPSGDRKRRMPSIVLYSGLDEVEAGESAG